MSTTAPNGMTIPTFAEYKAANPRLASMYSDSALMQMYNLRVDWIRAQPAPTPTPPTPPPQQYPKQTMQNISAGVSTVQQVRSFFGGGQGAAKAAAIKSATRTLEEQQILKDTINKQLSMFGSRVTLNGGTPGWVIRPGMTPEQTNNFYELLEKQNLLEKQAEWANADLAEAQKGSTSAFGKAKNYLGNQYTKFSNWMGWGKGQNAKGALPITANVVLAGAATWGLFNGVIAMQHGGFMHRLAGTVQTGASVFALAKSLGALGLSSPWVIGAIGVVAAATLLAKPIKKFFNNLLHRHKHDDSDSSSTVTEDEVPTTVFTTAPVVTMASGLAMAFIGLNLNTAPLYMSAVVPESAVVEGIKDMKATTFDNKEEAADARRDVFVYQGDKDGHTDTRVVTFKPGADGKLVANVYTLPKGKTFARGDDKKGIPYVSLFGSNGSINTAAVQAFDAQGAMLRAAQSVDPSKSWYAMESAAGQPHRTPQP